ncbi:MAG: hypothetical protein Q8L15_07510, partial [Methylobacter sp.]|nr:hypothetical protein [Methylobacter sp.]
MYQSTKWACLFSAFPSFSESPIGLSKKPRSAMNVLNLDLHPLNIQDNQKTKSTENHFPRLPPLLPFNRMKNMTSKLFFIVCIQGLLGLQQAYATTYYVSPSGANTNNGTSSSTPVKTISYALSKALKSGDIVYVMTGTYVEALSIKQSGITLAAYQNNKPVIDGQRSLPNKDWGSLIYVTGNNNTISGFEVKNSNASGARLGGYGAEVVGNRNTFSKMNMHHGWKAGIIIRGDYNIVEDSLIWQNSTNNVNGNGNGWGVGLSSARNYSKTTLIPGKSSYTILRRNKIYNNWGEGMSCFEADHCTMED